MTRINDYIWHLPHASLADDPPDVAALQQSFNQPLADGLESPLGELGYRLSSSDVVVRLDAHESEPTRTADTFLANVRFIAYLQEDVIVRVHFEHAEWAHYLADRTAHSYTINLDRFKVQDPATQVAVPAWEGRLHTRMSNRPGELHHAGGDEQIWIFRSADELEAQMQAFVEKFRTLGHPWLTDPGTM